MKNEIGGYIELGGLVNKPYHKDAIELNFARNALVYLIKSKKIKKIYIPYFLCDSVNVAKKFCVVEYYKINENLLPDIKATLGKNDYLYIVNYFGLISNDIIKELKKKYERIIVDNVQAFFQRPIEGVDSLYSCRKFFGVPDGAYLYTDSILAECLAEDLSRERYKYIIGRLEEGAQKYFEYYKECEKKISEEPVLKMSRITKNILGAIDYHQVKKKRTENLNTLNSRLRRINKLKFEEIEGAYTYPLYIENADETRKKLIKNKIFIPTLWPNVITENKDKTAYEYATKILPLPCDQRYGKEEMIKIIEIIEDTNNE